MNRAIKATGVAAATAAIALTATATTASADTNAKFGEWTHSGYTDWQADPTLPSDPDGQAGEDNLANVVQIGKGDQTQVPGTTQLEVSDWLEAEPDEPGWVLLPGADGERWFEYEAAHDKTVVTSAPWTETIIDERAHWQRYSWTGGPIAEGSIPEWTDSNDPNWQANVKGDPHKVGMPGAYQRGKPGNADWFYLEEVPAVTHTVEHEAGTEVVREPAKERQEFRFQREVSTPVTMYRWSVEGRTNTAAVTDSGTGGVTDSGTGGDVSTSDLSDTAENTETSTENTETEDVSASSHEAGTDELAHTGASGVTGPSGILTALGAALVAAGAALSGATRRRKALDRS